MWKRFVDEWMYTTQHLSEETIESIDAQLCEKYDLCCSCGMKGHFVSACPRALNMPSKVAYNNNKASYRRTSEGGYEDDSSCFDDSNDDEGCDSSSLSDSSDDEVDAHGESSCFDDSCNDYDFSN